MIIAIAAGVVQGIGLGHNSGRAHHARSGGDLGLACAEGGRRETLAGLAGLGDLVFDVHGRSEPEPAREWNSGVVGNSTTF